VAAVAAKVARELRRLSLAACRRLIPAAKGRVTDAEVLMYACGPITRAKIERCARSDSPKTRSDAVIALVLVDQGLAIHTAKRFLSDPVAAVQEAAVVVLEGTGHSRHEISALADARVRARTRATPDEARRAHDLHNSRTPGNRMYDY